MAEGLAPGKPRGSGGATPSSLTRGTRLGRYELLTTIGVGGMAKVWAARQLGHGGFSKVVAIKTILPHLSREQDFERLFVDEARVASMVHHPNVCEIFELGEDGQVLYLVMEWVDGDSLVKMLKGAGQEVTPIDARIAAFVGAETCAGIHAAHIQGDNAGSPLNIVHRDISPHNILLSADGVVKVTDFGVAKAAGQTHDETIAGQLKGKLEYMSPEQVTGARVDGRTDVFGMGGVLYEATTGRQPFASAADLEVMTKIVEGRLVPPSKHVSGYPRKLEDIILQAMANKPSDRFATADDMRVALERWIGQTGKPVAHASVAAVLRSRVGPKIDERLTRIREAMGSSPARSPSHTPSTSGIIPSPPPRLAPPPQDLAGEDDAILDADLVEEVSDSDGDLNGDTVTDGVALRAAADLLYPEPAAPRPAAQEPPVEPEPVALRQYVVAAAVGVAIAIAVGGVGLLAWHWMDGDATPSGQVEPAPGTVASAVAVAPEPPVSTATHAPEPRPSGSPLASLGDAAMAAVAVDGGFPYIAFRVVPASATVYLDGHAVPSSGRLIPRLEPGRTVTATIRADGYLDETLHLDDTVNGSVDVLLTPRDPPAPSSSTRVGSDVPLPRTTPAPTPSE